MKTELILARHGETEWNEKSLIQGAQDIPLNKRGVSQAHKLADRLAGEQLAGIYTSNLQRAVKTAEIITNKHNLAVKQKPNLQEINFGIWEGKSFAEIEEEAPDWIEKWKSRPDLNGPPQGENLTQLRNRAATVLEEIIDTHQGEKVLVVSHGGVIRALVSHYLGMPLADSWQLMQGNTAVNKLNFYEEVVMLEQFNSLCHLQQE